MRTVAIPLAAMALAGAGCADAATSPQVAAGNRTTGLLNLSAESVRIPAGEGRNLSLTVTRTATDSVLWTYRNRERGDFSARLVRVVSDGGRLIRDEPVDPLNLQLAFSTDTSRFVALQTGTLGTVFVAAVDATGRPLAPGKYTADVAVYVAALQVGTDINVRNPYQIVLAQVPFTVH